MCQEILFVRRNIKLQTYGIKEVYILDNINAIMLLFVEQTLVSSTVADCYAEIWTTSDLPQPQNTETECSNPRGTVRTVYMWFMMALSIVYVQDIFNLVNQCMQVTTLFVFISSTVYVLCVV